MESFSFPSYRLNCRQRPLPHDPTPRRKSSSFMMISSKGSNNGPEYVGKLVDESMIVLRMRIKEMKISESRVEMHSNWMEWERQYFLHYNADVCEAVGVLQNFLMNIRPSLAVAIVALVLLGLPICTGVTLFHALQIAQGFTSSFNSS